jgi:ribosome biogenesis GTPase / thiamine phosphate phosphatase
LFFVCSQNVYPMKATVYKSTGSWYIIKLHHNNKLCNARVKGVLKIGGSTSTNPIAVGDVVEVDLENEVEDTYMVKTIAERRNYMTRQSPGHKHKHHIIAANLDCSALFITIKDPKTSLGFIDRFLVTAEMYHVPAIIVCNKFDTYNSADRVALDYYKNIYETIGYKFIEVSMLTGHNINLLQAELAGKTTLLSGHSGTGKSTFINYLFPEKNLRTQEVSDWSGKGLHTTTFAEMYDLPMGGALIDTPGIRELGLVNIKKEELNHYFPEMKNRLHLCKYNNCMHINEPNCGIKAAVNEGSIAHDRYASYLTILDTIIEKHG